MTFYFFPKKNLLRLKQWFRFVSLKNHLTFTIMSNSFNIIALNTLFVNLFFLEAKSYFYKYTTFYRKSQIFSNYIGK